MSNGRTTATVRIVGLTSLTRGKQAPLFVIVILTLRFSGMPTILLLNSGGKTQTENTVLQNQNPKRRKSPESPLFVMKVPILVLHQSKSEDVNLSAKLNQRTAWT